MVLRLADLDALITTHHSLSLELIPVLSEEQWEQHLQLLYITQHIHICLVYTSENTRRHLTPVALEQGVYAC